jgi:hypothetical protein
MPDDATAQTLLGHAVELRTLMMAAATTGAADDSVYQALRRHLVDDRAVAGVVPAFLREHCDVQAFRTWAQALSRHWHTRRAAIANGFYPLTDLLEADLDGSNA